MMSGTQSPLTAPFTLAVLAVLCGVGMGFLVDSKQLEVPLKLTLEPKYVTRAHTENVTLRCEPGTSQDVEVATFTMVRILKQDPSDATGNTWLPIVKKQNVKVEDAALEFVWPIATADTFGVYHCDAIGFTTETHIVSGNTPNIEIKMDDVTAQDVLDVFSKSSARLEDEITSNSAEIGDLRAQFEELSEVERNRSAAVNRRLAASEHAMETVMHRLLFPETAWPTGQYALPQPDTGCPLDINFYGGHTGYFTMHGESSQGTSATSVNPKTRLAKPVKTVSGNDALVTLRFCTSNTVSANVPWPKGEYCIHSVTGSCPAGFSQGRIMLGTESTDKKDEAGGNHPYYKPSDLWFCCTKTGSYSTPIVLPTDKPFYLYRHKSPCQVVAGMNVEIDYFEIALETSSNGQSGMYPYTVFKTKSRRFELCYYSKKETPN